MCGSSASALMPQLWRPQPQSHRPMSRERSFVDLDPSSQGFLLRGRQPNAELERLQKKRLFFKRKPAVSTVGY